MRTDTPNTIILTHNTAPAWRVDTVDLHVAIHPGHAEVRARLACRRNPQGAGGDLVLNGEALALQAVSLDGDALDPARYTVADDTLAIAGPLPDAFVLETVVRIEPDANTQLSGLYRSKDGYFSQCEAQGFRRITFYPDRPDVMARFTCVVEAERDRFPQLLSNGNLVASGPCEDDASRHWARWEDPFPKPAYLFALVAAKLDMLEDEFVTGSGRKVRLAIYVEPGKLDQCGHAMAALKKSMRWDEERFGLEMDLDHYMIVAVGDFNMGAMENKGLNIFNTKYVLANQATATDADYANIESVVGHEYFHNWTGNRVTCRDWFQLSLKEGLTVFRDQEFSQDLCSDASARAVKRIEDVRVLRTNQFPEDAGPMAHPVRPDSYIEINNFYTVTIYEKGAEVVRMMQTLVASPNDPMGRDGFAKGMTLYFARHDGQAVTCDDFAQAIADANPASALARLLPQFKRWYSQAGTPRLQARGHYDASAKTYTLDFSQSCAATPGQPSKEPFVLPVSLGLVGTSGATLPLQLQGSTDPAGNSHLFVLTQPDESITFINVGEEPVPSILRAFSAPVVLDFDYSDAQLLTLLAHDPDPFSRWEAGQRLALRSAISAMADSASATGASPLMNEAFIEAMRSVLRHPTLDAAFKELVLTLPSETYIAEQLDVVDPQRIHAVREAMRSQLATALAPDWLWAFDAHSDNGSYRPDPVSSGRRALAGMALMQLCLAARDSGDAVWPGRAYQRFKDAGNMTDRVNALNALVNSGHELAVPALARFHALFKNEELVLDKWFALQAGACDRGGQVLPAVRQLMTHPDFHLRNPNRARSVIFSYCNANPGAFHRPDAAGYVFWSERVVELDSINPQVAARLARALDRWKKLAEPYRSAAREAIARVAAKPDLSNDVREVVTRALAD
jgi:aminopeptidase N